MALDPKDQQLMRDAFYEALDRWSTKKGGGFGGAAPSGGSGPGAAASGASIAGKALENLGGVAKGVAGAAFDLSGKLAKGGMTVTDATRTLGSNLEKAGGAGGNLAAVLGKGVGAFSDVIEYVEEGVDVFRQLSQTGATFNNSVVDMRAAAAGSRLTMQEFGGIIKDNNTSFLSLSHEGEKGAKAFAKLSKGFFDSGFGDKLTQLGYTSEDLNKLMAIQMTNMSARELKEKGGAEAQYQSTAKLAEEMDLMAKLTGKSRKEQEEALAKSKASGQVQAAVQLEALNGNKNAGEAFDAVVSSTSGKFGELIQQMVSAGRPLTDEGRKYMGMLSQETQAAIQESRDAYKRGDVEGAREAAKRAQALESAEAATNKSRLALAAQGVKGFEESTQEGIRYGKLLAEKAKELGTNITDPKAIEAARKSLEADAKKEQAARSGETASVIEAQNRIKDMGSAIQESIIVPLKDEANKKALNDFYKTLADLNQSKAKGGTATSDKGFAGDVSKGLDDIKKELLAAVRGFSEKGPDQKFSSDAAKAQNQAQVTALQKSIEGSSRKFNKQDENQIVEFTKSLKSVDGEVISKRIAEIAEKSGKTQEQVIAEAVNKPGGIGNLTKQLGEDPAAKKVIQQSSEAAAKERDAAAATRMAQEKGRDTSGTSGDALAKGLKSGLEGLGSLTTKTIDLFKVEGDLKIEGVNINKRASGGYIGKPEVSLIGEEGPEWVLNKEQMAATLEGAANRGMEQMGKLLPPPDLDTKEDKFKTIYDSMKSMSPQRGNPTGGADGLDLSSISKSITTSISSVAGGDVTTTKRTQSDDSKTAEAEMDSLRTKFFEDWAKRKEVIIEEMSVEDRKYSKVQAAMKADEEAMKIKEEYEKKKEELQKKIDDGIKWEVETKKEAVGDTEKILSEQLLILKMHGAEQLAITEFNEEEKKKALTDTSDEISSAMQEMLVTGRAVSENATKKVVGGASFDDVFKPVRMSAQSMMEQFGKENEQKKVAEQKAADAKKDPKATKPEEKKDANKPTASNTAATLDQVVEALLLLNSNMSKLLTQSESLSNKQIRATKATSNSVQP
jgi:hypothetical protein